MKYIKEQEKFLKSLENDPEEYAKFRDQLTKKELDLELKKHDSHDVYVSIDKWVKRFPTLNIAEIELVSF